MEDQGIIALFFDRSEQAIEETDKKYGGYCYSIAYNILSNREDSEESVSDTYLAAWNTIPPRRPNFLNAFLAKMTRHISIDRWRKLSAKKRGGGEIILALDELEECVDSHNVERQSHFMIGFRIPPEADFWLPPEEVADSFAHYISYVLENRNAAGNRDVDQLEYCITDLNSDGQSEVLLRYRDTGKYREILQMVEDPTSGQPVVSIRFINGYLYEGPVFESVIDDNKVDGFLYYEYRDFDWNSIACLRYDPETKTWTQSSSKGNTFDAIWEPISESEANAIRRSYKPLSLDMKPLSQFNMNG